MAVGVHRRAREYGTLLLGALAGGIVGALLDQLTCTISPEYFLVGKALSAGPAFRLDVAMVGFRGGLAVGALIAGVDLIVRSRRPHLRCSWWVRPVALATVVAMGTCSALLVALDPFELGVIAADSDLTTSRRFLTAWGIHMGAYAGPILALSWGALQARRETAPSS